MEGKSNKVNEERGGTTNPRRHNSYNYNHIDLGIEATVTIQETNITNIMHNAKDNT